MRPRCGPMPCPLAGQLLEPEPARSPRRLRGRALGPACKGAPGLADEAPGATGGAPRCRLLGAARRWRRARAGSSRALVNTFGEVFQANTGDVEDEPLPTLSGPPGTAPQMLRMWQQLSSQLRDLGEGAEGAGAHRTPGAVQPRVLACPVCRRCRDRNRTRQRRRDRGPGGALRPDPAADHQPLPDRPALGRPAHQDGYAVRLRAFPPKPHPPPGKPAKQNH